MPLVFQRRLALPLWVVALFAFALTAPPTAMPFEMPPAAVFALTAIGIAAILFVMPRPVPWLHTSRAMTTTHLPPQI